MNNKDAKNVCSISIIVPNVVVGVLLALKHIGTTSISYWAIIVFGLKVWAACAIFIAVVWLLFAFIFFLFGGR